MLLCPTVYLDAPEHSLLRSNERRQGKEKHHQSFLRSSRDHRRAGSFDDYRIAKSHWCILQISIGLIVELLSFVPSLVLIQFFRRIRSRGREKKKKPNEWTLPWWCLFIAYGCSLLLAIVSIFFIIVRGIEFGDSKTQKWLTSLLAGFFSSILLIQPIKVKSNPHSLFHSHSNYLFLLLSKIGLLAIFFACCSRKTDEDPQVADYLDDDLEIDEQNDSPFHIQPVARPRRLDPQTLAKVRQERLREMKMWSIIQEIILHLCFVFFANVVVYSQFQPNASYHVQHLHSFFSSRRHTSMNYQQVSHHLLPLTHHTDEKCSLSRFPPTSNIGSG